MTDDLHAGDAPAKGHQEMTKQAQGTFVEKVISLHAHPSAAVASPKHEASVTIGQGQLASAQGFIM